MFLVATAIAIGLSISSYFSSAQGAASFTAPTTIIFSLFGGYYSKIYLFRRFCTCVVYLTNTIECLQLTWPLFPLLQIGLHMPHFYDGHFRYANLLKLR